jgi:phosphohistidine phosphatase SixA
MDVAPHAGKCDALEALAPGSNAGPLLAWTKLQTGDVAWVGHAPDVGQLTAVLIGDGSSSIHFNKGATACIEFTGPVAAGRGELCWLATAKLLDG